MECQTLGYGYYVMISVFTRGEGFYVYAWGSGAEVTILSPHGGMTSGHGISVTLYCRCKIYKYKQILLVH